MRKFVRITIYVLIGFFFTLSFWIYQHRIECLLSRNPYFHSGYNDLADDSLLLISFIKLNSLPMPKEQFISFYCDSLKLEDRETFEERLNIFSGFSGSLIHEKSNLEFWFENDQLVNIRRNLVDIVSSNNENVGDLYVSPSISFLAGYNIYKDLLVQSPIEIFTLIPILILTFWACIKSILYYFKENYNNATKNILQIQIISLIGILIFHFLYHYKYVLDFCHGFRRPGTYFIEQIYVSSTRLMLYPAILFDLFILNFCFIIITEIIRKIRTV